MEYSNEQSIIIDKADFYEKLDNYYNKEKTRKPFTKEEILRVIADLKEAKSTKTSKTRQQYYFLKKYDIFDLNNTTYLIIKSSDPATIEYVPSYEELYDLIYDCHVTKTGHGGRSKMMKVPIRYKIPRCAFEIFLSCCRTCNEKKPTSNKIVVRPRANRSHRFSVYTG